LSIKTLNICNLVNSS